MAFIKVSRSARCQMFREGGYREREIMKNATCVTNDLGRKDCVKFHDTKHGKTATYRYGRGWVN
ncbi:MAG: hypothetical protein HFK05_03590 [Clostridia bacterium]|nr:hypothetical protein [Clostridia bacterium]